MLDVDQIIRPWYDRLVADTGELSLYDAHTHIGRNDPDGFKQEPEELIAALERAGARAATFPMHEPGGYPRANDETIQAAKDFAGMLPSLWLDTAEVALLFLFPLSFAYAVLKLASGRARDTSPPPRATTRPSPRGRGRDGDGDGDEDGRRPSGRGAPSEP